jgi:hypothetical protein
LRPGQIPEAEGRIRRKIWAIDKADNLKVLTGSSADYKFTLGMETMYLASAQKAQGDPMQSGMPSLLTSCETSFRLSK